MQVIETAVRAVSHLRSLGCQDIEFSPEDAGEHLIPDVVTPLVFSATLVTVWDEGPHGLKATAWTVVLVGASVTLSSVRCVIDICR